MAKKAQDPVPFLTRDFTEANMTLRLSCWVSQATSPRKARITRLYPDRWHIRLDLVFKQDAATYPYQKEGDGEEIPMFSTHCDADGPEALAKFKARMEQLNTGMKFEETILDAARDLKPLIKKLAEDWNEKNSQ